MRLNKEVINRAADIVRMGLSWEDASLQPGIPQETFWKWIEAGKQAKSGLRYDLVAALEQAKKDNRELHLKNIREPARKGDKAAQKWLRQHGIGF